MRLADLRVHIPAPSSPGDSHLGRWRPASLADLVDALIAEGGERMWWCEAEAFARYEEPTEPWGVHDCLPEYGCGWRLVYGPIPAEKETTT